MNAMLFVKMVFFMAVLLLLVLMGVHNRGEVDFNLPPLMKNVIQQPAALMYFAFFAVGMVSGAILSFGGRRKPADKGQK